MRIWFTMAGLLVTLGVVAWLAKSSLAPVSSSAVPVTAPSSTGEIRRVTGTPQNAQAIEQNVRQQLDAAAQSRAMPAEAQ